MVLFLLFSGLALALLLFVLARPAFRRPRPESANELAAGLRDRLAEIDMAQAGAILDDEEADAARAEIKRAALHRLDREPEATVSRATRFAALLYLGLAPLGAAALYWQVGAPAAFRESAQESSAADPAALAALPPAERDAQIRAMVDGLAARLKDNPGDIEGLRRLARAQMVLGRFDEARAAFVTLFSQIPGDVEDWRNYAGLFVAEAGAGAFPTAPEFLRALGELDKRAPGDGFVLFFRGGAAHAKGDITAALADWRRLLTTIPENEPARARLKALIAETERATPPGRSGGKGQ